MHPKQFAMPIIFLFGMHAEFVVNILSIGAIPHITLGIDKNQPELVLGNGFFKDATLATFQYHGMAPQLHTIRLR
jgi:hypothetical protein